MINDDGRNKLEGEKGKQDLGNLVSLPGIWDWKGQVRLSPGLWLWQCKAVAVLWRSNRRPWSSVFGAESLCTLVSPSNMQLVLFAGVESKRQMKGKGNND